MTKSEPEPLAEAKPPVIQWQLIESWPPEGTRDGRKLWVRDEIGSIESATCDSTMTSTWKHWTTAPQEVLPGHKPAPLKSCRGCFGSGQVEIQRGPYFCDCEACGGTGKQPNQPSDKPL